MDRRPHDLDDRSGDPVVVQHWLGAPAFSYERRPDTVPDVLDRAIRLWPDAPGFLEPDGAVTTYAAFGARVERAAASLVGRGLRPGDAVAVAAGNTLDLATLLHACARAGLVMVGLNTRLAPDQWTYMVAVMECRLLLAEPAYALPGAERLADVLREAPDQPWSYAEVHRPAEDATYAVVFTSGTTGRPKASQVVHRSSVHSAMSYQRVLALEPGEVTAVLFALYYISAQHAHVLPAMLGGATCLLLDGPSPREYVDLLERYEVSWAYAVPSWWRLCLRVEGFRDLPHLRRLAAGGAPFGADLEGALRERLPATLLHDVYGLSETHSPATLLLDHEFAGRPGCVGRLLDCMEAEVRDDAGVALPPGSPGQLWLRGSLVTTGYAHNDEATRAAIVNGWFDTGDVARIDADGYVWVLDRSKDMINRGGTKIFSAELEELLREHPSIEDAAAVPVPDNTAGEAVAVFLVLSAPVTPAEVRAWVRTGMADYAAPKVVHFVDALPRNATGKTDKLSLRNVARGGFMGLRT
ncbi:MAG: class I adenylate-forming enzyme family protein [Mycobacteriales bacterium]